MWQSTVRRAQIDGKFEEAKLMSISKTVPIWLQFIAGTEYWLLVLSPSNRLPPDRILIVVSISPSQECQQVSFQHSLYRCYVSTYLHYIVTLPLQKFEEHLRAEYSHIEFHRSKQCLVTFERGYRARFHMQKPSCFKVTTKEGTAEVRRVYLEKDTGSTPYCLFS